MAREACIADIRPRADRPPTPWIELVTASLGRRRIRHFVDAAQVIAGKVLRRAAHVLALAQRPPLHCRSIGLSLFTDLLIAPDHPGLRLRRAVLLLHDPHTPLQPVVAELATRRSHLHRHQLIPRIPLQGPCPIAGHVPIRVNGNMTWGPPADTSHEGTSQVGAGSPAHPQPLVAAPAFEASRETELPETELDGEFPAARDAEEHLVVRVGDLGSRSPTRRRRSFDSPEERMSVEQQLHRV
jgi:hypothetical protein